MKPSSRTKVRHRRQQRGLRGRKGGHESEAETWFIESTEVMRFREQGGDLSPL